MDREEIGNIAQEAANEVILKEECLRKMSSWVNPVQTISRIPIDELETYKSWKPGQPSVKLNEKEIEAIKDAVSEAKKSIAVDLKGPEGQQLLADLDGIIEDGKATNWVLTGELGALRVDDSIHDVQMSVIEDMVKEMVVCECKSNPEELGGEIAKETGLRYDGVQEGLGMQFTDVEETGTTFYANTLEEAKAQLAEIRRRFAAAKGSNPGDKTTIYGYAKINVEGVVFRTEPKRGWYYKGEFIGYNAQEAIEAINKIKELAPEGSNPGEYITIADPGKTTFKPEEIVSREAFEKENERVRKLGEKPATGR